MKFKTSELQVRFLNWAVAKAEGRILYVPDRATNEDLAELQVPFKMYGVRSIITRASTVWDVEEIAVTRFGVNHLVGATVPSISFTDSTGERGLGSADLFHLTREAAQLEADQENFGGLEGFEPSTDWAQGGPIIERRRISVLLNSDGNWEAGTAWEFFQSESFAYHRQGGPTPLIAAMRCYVASKWGDEVEIPEELL